MQRFVASPAKRNSEKVLQCPRSPQRCRVTNFPVTFMARAMDLSRATATTRRRRWTQAPPRSRERPPWRSTGNNGYSLLLSLSLSLCLSLSLSLSRSLSLSLSLCLSVSLSLSLSLSTSHGGRAASRPFPRTRARSCGSLRRENPPLQRGPPGWA